MSLDHALNGLLVAKVKAQAVFSTWQQLINDWPPFIS